MIQVCWHAWPKHRWDIGTVRATIAESERGNQRVYCISHGNPHLMNYSRKTPSIGTDPQLAGQVVIERLIDVA